MQAFSGMLALQGMRQMETERHHAAMHMDRVHCTAVHHRQCSTRGLGPASLNAAARTLWQRGTRPPRRRPRQGPAAFHKRTSF